MSSPPLNYYKYCGGKHRESAHREALGEACFLERQGPREAVHRGPRVPRLARRASVRLQLRLDHLQLRRKLGLAPLVPGAGKSRPKGTARRKADESTRELGRVIKPCCKLETQLVERRR